MVRRAQFWVRMCSGPGLPHIRGDGGYCRQPDYDGENCTPEDQRLGPADCLLKETSLMLHHLGASYEHIADGSENRMCRRAAVRSSSSVSDPAGDGQLSRPSWA